MVNTGDGKEKIELQEPNVVSLGPLTNVGARCPHYRHLVALRTHIAVEVHHIQRHRIYPHTHLARRRHKVRGIYTTVVARLYLRIAVKQQNSCCCLHTPSYSK